MALKADSDNHGIASKGKMLEDITTNEDTFRKDSSMHLREDGHITDVCWFIILWAMEKCCLCCLEPPS